MHFLVSVLQNSPGLIFYTRQTTLPHGFQIQQVQGKGNYYHKPSTIITGREGSKYFPTEVFHKPKVQLLLLGATFPTCFYAQKNYFSRDPNLVKLLQAAINVRIHLYSIVPSF